VVLTSHRAANRHGAAGRHPDEGAVALLAVIVMAAVLLPLTAIVIDLGLARDVRSQAQTTADSAALAAAIEAHLAQATGASPPTAISQARQRAREYVDANMPTVSSDFRGCAGCVAVDLAAKNVTVTLPDIETSRAFTSGVGIAVSARASWALDQRSCSVCITNDLVLGSFARKATVRVRNGDVDLGGQLTAANAFSSRSGGTLRLDTGTLGMIQPGAIHSPATTTASPFRISQVGDPYARSRLASDLGVLISTAVAPDPLPAGQCGPPAGQVVVYYDTISRCTDFAPGVYVLTSGSQRFQADPQPGTLFVATCSSPFDLSPMACSNTSKTPAAFFGQRDGRSFRGYQGPALPSGETLAIAVDAGDTAPQALSNLSLEGDVYAPGVTLTLSDVDVRGRLVAGTVHAITSIQIDHDVPVQDGPVHLVQ
jgi:Flp pilus assembly protein TadG